MIFRALRVAVRCGRTAGIGILGAAPIVFAEGALAVAAFTGAIVLAKGVQERFRRLQRRRTEEAGNAGLPSGFVLSTPYLFQEESGAVAPVQVSANGNTYVVTNATYKEWMDALFLEFPLARSDAGTVATMVAFLRTELRKANWRISHIADFAPRVVAMSLLDTRRTLVQRELAARDPGRFVDWVTGATPFPRWTK